MNAFVLVLKIYLLWKNEGCGVEQFPFLKNIFNKDFMSYFVMFYLLGINWS